MLCSLYRRNLEIKRLCMIYWGSLCKVYPAMSGEAAAGKWETNHNQAVTKMSEVEEEAHWCAPGTPQGQEEVSS